MSKFKFISITDKQKKKIEENVKKIEFYLSKINNEIKNNRVEKSTYRGLSYHSSDLYHFLNGLFYE